MKHIYCAILFLLSTQVLAVNPTGVSTIEAPMIARKITVTLIGERDHFHPDAIKERSLNVRKAARGEYITVIEGIYHNVDNVIDRSALLDASRATEEKESELRGLENSYAAGYAFLWALQVSTLTFFYEGDLTARGTALLSLWTGLLDNPHLKAHWKAMKADKDRFSDPLLRKLIKIHNRTDAEITLIRQVGDSFTAKIDAILERNDIVKVLSKVDSSNQLVKEEAPRLLPSKTFALNLLLVAHELLIRYAKEAMTDEIRKMWATPAFIAEGPDIFLMENLKKYEEHFNATLVGWRDLHFGNAALFEINRGIKIGKDVVLIVGNRHREGVRTRVKKEFGDSIEFIEKQVGESPR